MNESNEKKIRLSAEQKSWGITALLVVCLGILFFFLCYRWEGVTGGVSTFSKIFQPFLVGIVLAWLLVPLYNILEQFFWPRFIKKFSEKRSKALTKTVCSVISILVVLGILYAFFAMIIPGLIQSVSKIVSNSDKYLASIKGWGEQVLERNPAIGELFDRYSTLISSELTTYAKDTILPKLTGLVGTVSVTVYGILKFIINFIIGIVACIYLLNAKRQLASQSKRLCYAVLGARKGNAVLYATRFINKVFSGFIAGKIWDSLIIGVICLVCCKIMQMPYALLVSVIVCVTNVVPCFGPFIGAIPSALLILVESPIKCLYFVVFIIVLQQIDGNVIGPKILGDSVGLSALWILFSIVVFGGLFGFWGMLLGVPVFTCIYTFCRWLIKRALAKKELPVETEDYRGVVSIDPETGEFNNVASLRELNRNAGSLFQKNRPKKTTADGEKKKGEEAVTKNEESKPENKQL